MGKIDTIIFATNNAHKLVEVQALMPQGIELVGLAQMGIHEDIPKDGDTLEANALQKARYIYAKTQRNCFADDTGLEVEVLNNAPGVYSARYAGPQKSSADNMAKLLHELRGQLNRSARFRTVIALIIDGREHLFEGIVRGHIIEQQHGTEGFGYDPIFVPEGYTETFAQMPLAIKNGISHRGRAVQQLVDFLSVRK